MATHARGRTSPLDSPIARVEYNPLQSAIKVHNSDAQVKAICGPVGSGKTSIGCWEFYFMMAEAVAPLRFCILRESYRQLQDSTRRTWEEWFAPCTTYIKSEETLRVRVNNPEGQEIEHEVHLRHARRPEEASNLMSTEYAGIWLEEVTPAYQMGRGIIGTGLSKEIFDMATIRIRQRDAHRTLILLTFNPPSRHHWAYKAFWLPEPQLKKKDFALFKQPARENAVNLKDPNYYEKMQERLDPELVKRFVEGEPVTMYGGAPVYPECFQSIHCRERLEVTTGFPLVIGFDYGLTPVALITQVLPGGALRVLKEIQLFNAGMKRLAEELVVELNQPRYEGANGMVCWGDPTSGPLRSQADERTALDELKGKGFDVKPSAITFEERRTATRDRFERTIDGEPAILIDEENCPMLAEGLLGAYRFEQYHDGHLSEKPKKNQWSHSAEALEYICAGEFSYITGKHRDAEQREKEREERRPKWNPLGLDEMPPGGGWMSK